MRPSHLLCHPPTNSSQHTLHLTQKAHTSKEQASPKREPTYLNLDTTNPLTSYNKVNGLSYLEQLKHANYHGDYRKMPITPKSMERRTWDINIQRRVYTRTGFDLHWFHTFIHFIQTHLLWYTKIYRIAGFSAWTLFPLIFMVVM